MDHSEEMIAEVDEPPDSIDWSPTKLHFDYLKFQPRVDRRESLLTRQLHSETEHTDDDMSQPPRTLSTQSTWSNPSAGSMADLTSDDGHSVASPAISPPLRPTQDHLQLPPVSEKPLEPSVKIVGQDDVAPTAQREAGSEKAVEANLGRKRCISFACRGKEESKPTPPPTSDRTESESTSTSPPKRKCMLKFVCPTRAGAENKATESKAPEKKQMRRPVSPPPPTRKFSIGAKHRGSDSTVTHTSPKSVRKNSVTSAPSQEATQQYERKYAPDSDDAETGKEAMRFHEFGTSEDEPEEWVQESTCHRSRLTVDDTLRKESVIRKACEEVEEEVLEEEEQEEDEDLDDELEAVTEKDEDDENEIEEDDDYESDEGFHSDDEGGFASSDPEDDDESDYEWWKPGPSTAATSVEHLDRLAIVNSQQIPPSTSAGSASSSQLSPKASRISLKRLAARRTQTPAVPIFRSASPDLPDSTDFVCGTLDEDRPLEQAYINRRKMRESAKHKARPQDIDPSFPTSDPEMDEEDDDDVDDAPDSEVDDMMHGDLDELHGAPKKATPMPPRGRSSGHKSPPAPTTRLHSPPPPRRSTARSPPPPTMRGSARSPPPRKLFGNSPNRMKSPATVKPMTSPPNSPTAAGAQQLSTAPQGLALGRPQLTHTASLPRGGTITLSKLAAAHSDEEDSDALAPPTLVPKRGAIDIVKGVEWKRQRRKEKLYQKACAKAAAKGDKNHKVKPGKGAERMREVGLQLQQYHGKAEHILSL